MGVDVIERVSEWVPPSRFLTENPGIISRDLLYRWARNKQIPTLRIGRKVLVPRNLPTILAIMQDRDAQARSAASR